MSTTVIFLIASICFSVGYSLGSFIRNNAYDNQPWEVMRWSGESLGYRPITMGTHVHRNDNVIAALRLNTSEIPKEGLQLEEG